MGVGARTVTRRLSHARRCASPAAIFGSHSARQRLAADLDAASGTATAAVAIDRLGERGAARLFDQHEHEVDLVHAQAAVLFGDQQAGDADLGELGPEFWRASGLGLP